MFISTLMPDCSSNSAKSISLTATSCRWFDIHVTVVPSNGLSWAAEAAAPAIPLRTPRRLSEIPDNGDLDIKTLLMLISERRSNARDADREFLGRAEGGSRRHVRSSARINLALH